MAAVTANTCLASLLVELVDYFRPRLATTATQPRRRVNPKTLLSTLFSSALPWPSACGLTAPAPVCLRWRRLAVTRNGNFAVYSSKFVVVRQLRAQQILIEVACQVLRDYPEWSIAAVARHLGYRHTPAFSRIFAERTGITPARWRRERGM